MPSASVEGRRSLPQGGDVLGHLGLLVNKGSSEALGWALASGRRPGQAPDKAPPPPGGQTQLSLSSGSETPYYFQRPNRCPSQWRPHQVHSVLLGFARAGNARHPIWNRRRHTAHTSLHASAEGCALETQQCVQTQASLGTCCTQPASGPRAVGSTLMALTPRPIPLSTGLALPPRPRPGLAQAGHAPATPRPDPAPPRPAPSSPHRRARPPLHAHKYAHARTRTRPWKCFWWGMGVFHYRP